MPAGKCAHCDENDARYVDENGALTCGVCPLRLGLRSWQITNVPALLTWLTTFATSLLTRLQGAGESPRVIDDWRRDLLKRTRP